MHDGAAFPAINTIDVHEAIQWTTESTQPAERLLRERRVCVDPRFVGELFPFWQRGPVRASYFRSTGLTVDEFAEALYDARLTASRPSERETLDFLLHVFRHHGTRRSRVIDVTTDDSARAIAEERRKAANNHHRIWTCRCRESEIRSHKLNLKLVCEECGSRLFRTQRTVFEIDHEIPLSVIQSEGYRAGQTADAIDAEPVPF